MIYEQNYHWFLEPLYQHSFLERLPASVATTLVVTYNVHWKQWGEWTPFILFLLEIPERKLVMLFQCLAKLLAWNGVPLGFDSELTGRTFPFSDSGRS